MQSMTMADYAKKENAAMHRAQQTVPGAWDRVSHKKPPAKNRRPFVSKNLHLYKACAAKGMTREETAKKCGCSVSAVARAGRVHGIDFPESKKTKGLPVRIEFEGVEYPSIKAFRTAFNAPDREARLAIEAGTFRGKPIKRLGYGSGRGNQE